VKPTSFLGSLSTADSVRPKLSWGPTIIRTIMERVPYWFYGKFTNMEIPLPEGSSNTLIIRFLWVTNALIFFP